MAVLLLCIAVVVPAIIYVALSVSSVQRHIADRAERELSQLLDCKVSIGSLGIVPFNRVLLRDVTITDKAGTDTMLTANRLGAGIRIASLLTDDPLTVTHVELMGMKANIHRDSLNAPLNIQPIINALRPKNPDQPAKKIDLRINTVMLRSSSINYDVLSEPVEAHFSPNHIAINNLRADISLASIKPGDFSFNIKRMGFTERSGFNLESFTAGVHISEQEISLANMALTLPRSNLRFADISLPLNGLDKIGEAIHTQQIAISITPDSYIAAADAAAFVPQLAQLQDKITFKKFEFNGNLIDASLNLNLTDGGSTSLQIEALAKNLDDLNRTDAYLKKLTFRTTGTEAMNVARLFHSIPRSTSALLGRLGEISITSNGSLTNRNFDIDLSLSTAEGNATITSTGTLHSAVDFNIDGEITTDGPISLGHLLNDYRIGNAGGSIAASYRQNRHSRNGSADIEIDLLTFKGVAYHDIALTAELTDNILNFNLDTDNTPLSIQATGAYSLAKNDHLIRLDGELRQFSPQKMNLTDGLEGMDISGNFDIDLSGHRFDNLAGYINLSGVTLMRSPSDAFTLQQLALQADSAHIELRSDVADATLDGSYDFRHISRTVKGIASKMLPAVIGYDTNQQHLAHPDEFNDFDFTIRLKESDRMAQFFNLPVSIIYPVEISGSVSEAYNDFALAIDAPYLRQGNKLIEKTRLSAIVSGADGSGTLDFTTTTPSKEGPLHIALSSDARLDHLATDLAWKISREKAYNGHISALTDFWRNDEDQLTTEVNLLHSNITFNDSTWTVNPATITLNGIKDIAIDGINVHRSNQFVRIDGKISDDAASLLTLDLRNFNLDYLFESLGIDKVMLGGDATGTFYASHLLSDQPILETPGLAVSNISYNRVILGDALVRSHWQQEAKAITLNAVINQPDSLKSFVDGAIYPLNDSLDIRFNVDKVNVGFMQPYMEAFASDIEGHASGQCRLWGNFKYIDLEGDVFADDLRLKINFTNTYYTASDSVHFRPGLIDLNGITIHDVDGNTADLNGWVRHKFFKEPWFEFSLSNAHNFLSYNESEKDNPIWYGKIYGNGGASVKGEPGRIDINVDMSTAPNSIFTFVLSDQEVADEYSFLTFRDKNKLAASLTDTIVLERDTSMDIVDRLRALIKAQTADLPSDYNISIQMQVTPQASIVLVMDPVGGDRIRAWGSGHLRMDYGSANNDLRMYGTYTLDRGYYNFTLQDVIIKDFTIKPGSKIVFNGDPYAAQLNIEAYYALNANLSDLDDSFLQDQELNRTNVPVHAIMKVIGDIRQPEIAFDLEFPTLTSDVYRKVRSIVSTDDMMNRQIIYLLALNRFYTPEYMTSTTKGNELVSVASSTISSQLSNMLGQISDNWNISPTFRSDRGDFSDVEVDVALSSRLLNNRLLFNGNFGYRDKTLNTNQFIGDFDLEYLLDREGRWRLKAYNRYNDQNYYLRTAKTTQGVGVVLKRDFDSFMSFFPFLRKKKKPLVPTPE